MFKLLFSLLLLCFLAKAQAQKIPSGSQATIGPRNGISYYVSSTQTITKPSSDYCGYSDLLLPNWAKFSQETRVYEEHENGKFIRSWVKKVDIFIECISI